MNPSSIYPCGRINRRGFRPRPAADFFGALGALGGGRKTSGAHLGPHFQPKAKSGHLPVHVRRYQPHRHLDPKDNKYAGKLIDAIGFGDNVAR
jgi:hypothetical protein